MIRLLCIAIGYCFGVFQTAFIYGKIHGIDIRTVGSGNAGTTNTLEYWAQRQDLLCSLEILLKLCWQ